MGPFALSGFQVSASQMLLAGTANVTILPGTVASTSTVFDDFSTVRAVSGIQHQATLSAEQMRVRRIQSWVDAQGGTQPITRLLIANRGDPAIRAIRAVKEFNEAYGLDIKVVVAHAPADAQDDFVQMADEAIPLDLGKPEDSYNNKEVLVELAQRIGADAIYPGWGFLSEKSDFAALVEQNDIIFVGPTAEQMELMGHKHNGLTAASEFNLPVGNFSQLLVPQGADLSDAIVVDQIIEDAVVIAREQFGFPDENGILMLKDSHGGGGTGNRRLKSVDDLRSALRTFIETGRTECFFEEFSGGEGITVQHIEFQVVGDGQGGAVVAGWRQCSSQRKDQKVFEMTHTHVPLEFLDEIQANIQRFMSAKQWRGPGTFEFLVATGPDGQPRAKFMEMNTRLQVEHGITEESYQIDIFREMLSVAMGRSLQLKQENLRQKQVTIEARILAENSKFQPQSGRIDVLNLPGGPGVRVDFAVSPGSEIRGDFDSMIGKLMVSAPIPEHDENDLVARKAALDEAYRIAIARMRRALRELEIAPLETNVPLLLSYANTDEFAQGRFSLGSLENYAESLEKIASPAFDTALSAAVVKAYVRQLKQLRDSLLAPSEILRAADLPANEGASFNIQWEGEVLEVNIAETGLHQMEISYAGRTIPVDFRHVNDNVYRLQIDGQSHRVVIDNHHADYNIQLSGERFEFRISQQAMEHDRSLVECPLAGKMWLSHVRPEGAEPSVRSHDDVTVGSAVKKGQILGIVSAMKSENPIEAPFDGIVTWVNPKYADMRGINSEMRAISKGEDLFRIRPLSELDGEEGVEAAEALPFAENRKQSVLESLRHLSDADDATELLAEAQHDIARLLPSMLDDMQRYFLGYDISDRYIERVNQILSNLADNNRRLLEVHADEIANILNVYRDIAKLRDPQHTEFYNRFVKGVGRGRFLVSDETFERHLVRVMNHYGLNIDPEDINWEQLNSNASQLFGNALLRFRLAGRYPQQRQEMLSRLLDTVGDAELRSRPMAKALEGIISVEADIFSNPLVRNSAAGALEKIDVVRYSRIHRPSVLPQYREALRNVQKNPAANFSEEQMALVTAFLEGRGNPEESSSVPAQLQDFLNDYERSQLAELRRVYVPFDDVFAFEVQRPGEEGESKTSYLILTYNILTATKEFNAELVEIIGSPTIQRKAQEAAHALRLLQSLQPVTDNHIYIFQNDQYPLAFDTTSSDPHRFNHGVIRRIGENIFPFFHGLKLQHTSVVAHTESASGDIHSRVMTFQAAPTGLHLLDEDYEAHFSESDPATRKQRARGLMTPQERADKLFGKGNYEEITYNTIDDLVYPDTPKNREKNRAGKPLPVGVKLYRGEVNGLPVMIYAGDFSVAGGAFGKLVGRKLARAQFEAYMQGIPLIGLMDGAGANILEGLVSLNYSAEDFMFKVITQADARDDMFARWLVNHPDRNLINELMADYGPGGSQDAAVLTGDNRFQDLAARMKSPGFSAAIQLGAGVGMVVYGSSLTPIQTMADLPQCYRILTGSRVRMVAKGESASDYDVGGAKVHARISGELMGMLGSEQEVLEHLAKLIFLFHPQSRESLNEIDRAIASSPAGETSETQLNGDLNGIMTEAKLARLVDRNVFLPYKEELRQGEGVSAGFGRLAGLPAAFLSSTTEAGFGTYAALFKAREMALAAEDLGIPVIKIVHGDWVDTTLTENPRAITTRQDLWETMAQLKVPQYSVVTSVNGINMDGVNVGSHRRFFVNTEKLSDEELFRIRRMNYEVVDSIEAAMDLIAASMRYFTQMNDDQVSQAVAADPVDRATTAAAQALPDEMETNYDVRDIIRDVVDQGSFHEIWGDINHPYEGPSLVVGLAMVAGQPRVVIADQAKILGGTPDFLGARKYREAVELAERYGLGLLILNDAPGFDPSQAQEAGNIQGEGAESMEKNISSTVPVVVLNLRKGYGGRWIHAFHPFLRPGIVSYIVEGSEIAVMGPGGKAAVFENRAVLAGGEDALREIMERYRSEGYGNPQLAIETGAAQAIIPKDELRAYVVNGFNQATAEAEIAFDKPYNVMTAADLNISTAIQRLSVMGFHVRAVAHVESHQLEVNYEDWTAVIAPNTVLRLLKAYPDADVEQIRHLFAQYGTSDSLLEIARARQQLAGLFTAIGMDYEIAADQLLFDGARYGFNQVEQLVRYAVPEAAFESTMGTLQLAHLSPEITIPSVQSDTAGFYSFDVVGSTNDVARRFIQTGVADGTAIIAAEQTVGRGRRNSHWHSPVGRNIYYSSIHHMSFDGADIARINLAVATTMAQLLRDEFGLEAQVKWPNDVYVNGRKIAGILTESANNLQSLIVGIGLNLNITSDELDPEIADRATSVFIETEKEVNREAFARIMQASIGAALELSAEDVELRYQQQALWPQGHPVRVRRLEADGSMMLVTEQFDAEVQRVDFATGDIVVIRTDTGEETLLSESDVQIRSRVRP